MTVIPAGFGQATLLFTGVGVPTGAAVTWGFANNSPYTATGAASVIEGSITTADLMNRFSTGVTLSTVRVKLGPVSTGPMAEVGSSDAGDTAGDTIPNTAVLIRKTTAFGGRAGSGRMFWPGITEADVATGGNLAPAALTSLQNDFTAWFELLATLDMPMALLHNDPANTPDLVTGLTVASTLATQRRRLRR